MTRDLNAMELRHLSALAAVARHASFSRAAEELGYTQSAISQQIARLERLVGQPVIERHGGPRPVTVTAAGEVLLKHAEAIVARVTSAAADLQALEDGASGTLRIGCYQSVGMRILPQVLRDFRVQWPKVQVELTENENDGDLLRKVEHGDLDLTFVVLPLPAGPFDSDELLADPYVVATGPGSPLADEVGPVSLRELSKHRLISYARMREVHAIEHRLGHPALKDQVVFRSNDNGTILGLAAEGVGVAVISWLSVDPHRKEIHVRAVSGVSPRIVGLAWHRDRYQIPAAYAFIDLARAAAARERELISAALPTLAAPRRRRAGH